MGSTLLKSKLLFLLKNYFGISFQHCDHPGESLETKFQNCLSSDSVGNLVCIMCCDLSNPNANWGMLLMSEDFRSRT